MNHSAQCLGTFTEKQANRIIKLIYACDKSRNVIIVKRGRGRNAEAKKQNPARFGYGVPKEYATGFALYVRPRPATLKRESMRKELTELYKSKTPFDLKAYNRIIRYYRRQGKTQAQIVKMIEKIKWEWDYRITQKTATIATKNVNPII